MKTFLLIASFVAAMVMIWTKDLNLKIESGFISLLFYMDYIKTRFDEKS